VSSKVRSITIAVVIVAVATGSFFLARREAMKRNWIKIDKYDIRSEGILQQGDLAPDLELERLDGTGKVKFSQFYSEKPLVLMFGSYT
jgi:hypothetical protein